MSYADEQQEALLKKALLDGWGYAGMYALLVYCKVHVLLVVIKCTHAYIAAYFCY